MAVLIVTQRRAIYLLLCALQKQCRRIKPPGVSPSVDAVKQEISLSRLVVSKAS